MRSLVIWLNANAGAVQAAAAIAVALLTLVLIAVTGYYARANWRVVRAMDKDLRFRHEPRVFARLEREKALTDKPDLLKIFVSVENGPAVLKEATVRLGHGYKRPHSVTQLFRDRRTSREGRLYLDMGPNITGDFTQWTVELHYSDPLGLFEVKATFDSHFPPKIQPYSGRHMGRRMRWA